MGELQNLIDETMGAGIPPDLQRLIDEMVQELVARGDWGVAEGSIAPDFTLPDQHGDPVALADRLASGPLVLQFYRGEWCPICNLSVRALQGILPEIEERGASLVTISPQGPDLASAMVEANDLTFDVLSDLDQQTITAYRLRFELSEALKPLYEQFDLDLRKKNADGTWTLPIPATFILDTDGVVRRRHVDPNYRQRMEPADILASLDAI